MRNPDFSSLLHILDRRRKTIVEYGCKPKVVEYAVLANAMTWFCKEALILGERKASNFVRDAMHVMALLIDEFGPQTHIRQSRRNLRIAAKLSLIDRFSTTLSEEQRAIADAEDLSCNRVAGIYRERFASTALAEFIESASEEKDVSIEQIAAAHDAITKIRRRLIQKGSKGEEIRSQICSGFGIVGKTILSEENHSDVETHRRAGLSKKEATEVVAKATGQQIAKVKSDHQRINARQTRDIDDVVSIANKGAVVVDESGNIVHIFPTIVRNDIRRN